MTIESNESIIIILDWKGGRLLQIIRNECGMVKDETQVLLSAASPSVVNKYSYSLAVFSYAFLTEP